MEKDQTSAIIDIKYLQSSSGEINITFLKKCLDDKKKLSLIFVENVLARFHSIIKDQPNVLMKNQPITIIGDIHGQFKDLLKILCICPNIDNSTEHTALFLGDYVDRGPFGMEVILLLMALKLNYKHKVFMLRGNHESRQMTQFFNFYHQCCDKYNQDIYFKLMDIFDCLPLACIIDNKYFCVHGGISPSALEISKIDKQNRAIEIPLEGVICDLLWSDPSEKQQGATQNLYQNNQLRNCSIIFGKELSQIFLKKNSLLTIIRAHQVQMQGFKQYLWPGWSNIPTVYTIFSAPNYCGTYLNKASILTITNQNFKIRQFKEQNPKYFVAEKFDAFNFTHKKLAQYVHGFCKRVAKVISKQVPQIKEKNITNEEVLALLLQYVSDRDIPALNLNPKTSQFPLKKQNQTQDDKITYQNSVRYFKDTEKRKKNSEIFINKKKKIKL